MSPYRVKPSAFFVFGQRYAVDERLHWRLPVTPAVLVGSARARYAEAHPGPLEGGAAQCLPRLHRSVPLTPVVERQLLTINARQLDRFLKARKEAVKHRQYGTTWPAELLKHKIPIKAGQWDVTNH